MGDSQIFFHLLRTMKLARAAFLLAFAVFVLSAALPDPSDIFTTISDVVITGDQDLTGTGITVANTPAGMAVETYRFHTSYGQITTWYLWRYDMGKVFYSYNNRTCSFVELNTTTMPDPRRGCNSPLTTESTLIATRTRRWTT